MNSKWTWRSLCNTKLLAITINIYLLLYLSPTSSIIVHISNHFHTYKCDRSSSDGLLSSRQVDPSAADNRSWGRRGLTDSWWPSWRPLSSLLFIEQRGTCTCRYIIPVGRSTPHPLPAGSSGTPRYPSFHPSVSVVVLNNSQHISMSCWQAVLSPEDLTLTVPHSLHPSSIP